MSSSRSIRAACEEALSDAPRLERGAGAGSARRGRSARRTPGRCSISRSSCMPALACASRKEDYLQLLARRPEPRRRGQGHRHGAARSGQARPGERRSVPGYALRPAAPSAIGAMMSTAIAALERLGLSRDDIIAETMRSPKQVEIRAKARGLKVPSGIHRFDALRRLAGARRERARPGARTGRDRAVFFRGARTPSRKEAAHDYRT